jgi:hypothetical protein
MNKLGYGIFALVCGFIITGCSKTQPKIQKAAPTNESSAPNEIRLSLGGSQKYQNLGCISPRKVSSETTVVDLYIALASCIKEGELSKAASLNVVADLFGRFDQKRVHDKTAYQTITDLQVRFMHNQMNEKQLGQFYQYLNRHYDEQSIEYTTSCILLRKIGYPTYHPAYIFTDAKMFKEGESTGFVQPFDNNAAWNDLLEDYLKCL